MSIDPAELSPRDVLAWLLAGTRLEVEAMRWLTALTGMADADLKPGTDDGPAIIVRRKGDVLSLPEPEATSGMQAIGFTTATAIAG